MKTSKLKKILWVLLLIALGVGAIWVFYEIKIDKCLDAGGSWNYDKKICEK